MLIIRWLPSIITILSMNLAIVSLYLVVNFDIRFSIMILIICAIMDWLDGFVARKLNVASDFGANLDSLADLVVFVVNPSVVLAYHYQNKWVFLALMIYISLGCIRLAKYDNTKSFFTGIPTPLAGLLMLVLVLFQSTYIPISIVSVYIVIASVAMVAPIRVKRILYKQS